MNRVCGRNALGQGAGSNRALDKNRGLEGPAVTSLTEQMGKHVADFVLDLAVEEKLETAFLLNHGHTGALPSRVLRAGRHGAGRT
jgi:hypothetical protein